MFPVSFSGLRSVGPNTIPKLCVDIRFTDSLAAILLTKGKNWLKMRDVKGVAVAFEVETHFTDSPNTDVYLVKLSKSKKRGREEAISGNMTNSESKFSCRQQDMYSFEIFGIGIQFLGRKAPILNFLKICFIIMAAHYLITII